MFHPFVLDRSGVLWPLIAFVLALAGCASGERLLVHPPTVFAAIGSYPDASVPEALRTTEPELLFVTDRAPVSGQAGLSYSADRSASMALGSVRVRYGDTGQWSDLVLHETDTALTLGTPRELVRFPETPVPFRSVGGRLVALEEPAQAYRAASARFAEALRARLRAANRREVVLFVHGFNNTFDAAAFSLADVWHHSGRIGVPVFYTWPSGNGGLFGYFKDRESGEYTVFHLKETIRLLASIAEVDELHIVAHSRGTDVATTALRELVIEQRAAGLNPSRSLKIRNLILAAPDLDFGIVRQRLIAERFGPAIGQITVYMNQGDHALALSQRLMAGQRFGRLTIDDLGPGERAIFSRIRNVHFIDIEGQSDLIGHAYFRRNPSVLSDIVIAIRTGAAPGDPERPLVPIGANFWQLPEGYPYQERRGEGSKGPTN